MTTGTELQTLTRYKAWANLQFFEVVTGLSEAQLKEPRPIVFGSLIRTLNHSYLMDYVWQCHLLGKSHGLLSRNPPEHPDILMLRQLQLDIDDWYVRYADTHSEQDLSGEVDFEFIGGGGGCMRRSDIVLHVVNHATYHRGHAADMLYTMGVAPPSTDLPVFLVADQ